jgi:hypothetical protein
MSEKSELLPTLRTMKSENWAWRHTPVILALGKQRQEDQKFEASVGYKVCVCVREREVEREREEGGREERSSFLKVLQTEPNLGIQSSLLCPYSSCPDQNSWKSFLVALTFLLQ